MTTFGIHPSQAKQTRHYDGRYPNLSNNGYRAVWLKNGAEHAAAINAARRGDIEAVVDHGKERGGLTQLRGWAKSAIKQAAKISADVPAYRIETTHGEKTVFIPNLSWTYRGNKQVAHIWWMPMFGVKIH